MPLVITVVAYIVFYLLVSVLNTFTALAHLILLIILSMYCYATEEETEAERGKWSRPESFEKRVLRMTIRTQTSYQGAACQGQSGWAGTC